MPELRGNHDVITCCTVCCLAVAAAFADASKPSRNCEARSRGPLKYVIRSRLGGVTTAGAGGDGFGFGGGDDICNRVVTIARPSWLC